jgi:IS605 OrfB family transposase
MWQIANEIVKLAKEFNANIAIERLRRLRKRKGEWSKNSRKKVNRIPYSFFRHALKHVAEREGVVIMEIKPYYTSQICPRCGYMSKDNWKGYVYFKCIKCGYEADRDRVASLNIALRAAPKVGVPKHYFWSQIPEGGASVSRHVLKDEGCGRWHQTTLSFKPTSEERGQLTKYT